MSRGIASQFAVTNVVLPMQGLGELLLKPATLPRRDMAGGVLKGTELDQQYGKDQQNCHDQHQQQIPKGLLLLLIETAVLDHSRRERTVGSELVPNLRNGAAQVAIFETRFDRYVLPQVLAVQFKLARRFGNVRNLREFYQVAIAGAQRQFAEACNLADVSAIDTHPNAYYPIALQHIGCPLAEHRSAHRGSYIIGGQPKPLGRERMHFQAERWAGVDKSVEYVDDAFDLLELFCHCHG